MPACNMASSLAACCLDFLKDKSYRHDHTSGVIEDVTLDFHACQLKLNRGATASIVGAGKTGALSHTIQFS